MKTCKNCQEQFEVSKEEKDFLEKISPEINGKKISVPEPTFCPECRQMRRMSYRNERKLYKRKCDITGKDIFATFPQDSPFKVCDKDYWWSDEFDPMKFGKSYDLSKSFFEQFHELELSMPLPALRVEKSENSDFNNDVGDCSNCYLCSRTHSCQNCLYTYRGNHSRDCVDCMQVVDSELLYNCLECVNCNSCKFCEFSINCTNSAFLFDCRSCTDCFLCSNLRNKQYYFLNKQLTREEYEKKLAEFDSGSYELIQKGLDFFKEIKNRAIYRNLTIVNSEGCTGDNIVDCKNCQSCFGLKFSEDSMHLWDVMRYKNSMDSYSGGRDSELIYETTAVAASYNVNFCLRVTESRNVSYSHFCRSSKNLFGCIGLNHKEFCILNKQYSEQEYYNLLEKIIGKMIIDGEYGEFFPSRFSPWAYNDTIANDFFPLAKDEALSRGFRWQEVDKKEYLPQTYVIPNNVMDISQSVLNEILACECTQDCLAHEGKTCGKNFKINPLELAFYLKEKLPLPHHCPDCRYNARQKAKNPMKLQSTKCSNCQKDIQTTIANRKLKVFCEECYEKAIYQDE